MCSLTKDTAGNIDVRISPCLLYLSSPVHHNINLGTNEFFSIGLKGASYGAARESIFHYLGP